MKNRWNYCLLLCLVVLCLCRSVFGQVMYADFENHGIGIIRVSSNWNRSSINNKAVVTTNHPYGGYKTLELYTNGYSSPHAIVHNFWHTNSAANAPIIRMSAMLYADNVSNGIIWGLGTGYTNRNLQIWTSSSYPHTIHVGSSDTGYELVTGRYARMNFYFDMDANRASLDYDGRTISTWKYCSNTLTNKFNLMHFIRATNDPAGRLLFDNVILDDFPVATWAWWRFEEGTGTVTRDHLGHFPMQYITNTYGANWLDMDPTWRYSGEKDLLDQHGLSAYAVEVVNPCTNTPVFTNWTIEALMRCDTNGFLDTAAILNWTARTNGRYHGATINYSLGMNFTPMIDLRDAQEVDSYNCDHFTSRATLPADNEWHHIAAVKEGTNLYFYRDSLMCTNYSLSSYASGSYQFSTNTSLFLGRAANSNAAVRTNHALSELRFTCRALAPCEFMQPLYAEVGGAGTTIVSNTLYLSMHGNVPQYYNLEGHRALTNVYAWNVFGSVIATNLETSVALDISLDDIYFYRVCRELYKPQM